MSLHQYREGSIAQSVMARIRREESWAFPISQQMTVNASPKRSWILLGFALLACLILVTLPLVLKSVAADQPQYPLVREVVGAGEIEYARSNPSIAETFQLHHMVASIGEPMLAVDGGAFKLHGNREWLILLMISIYLMVLWLNWGLQHLRRHKS